MTCSAAIVIDVPKQHVVARVIYPGKLQAEQAELLLEAAKYLQQNLTVEQLHRGPISHKDMGAMHAFGCLEVARIH